MKDVLPRIKGIIPLSALALLCACEKAPPPDPFCRYEEAPPTAGIKPDQGAIQILAPVEQYIYVFDDKGKQLASERTNRVLGVQAGTYQVRVNNSSHTVYVKSKTLSKCEAGALLATGATEQYFYVFDFSGAQLASERLGKAVALFPGKYEARLNNSRAAVEISPGAPIEIKSGTLSVPAKTDEYYYVFDSAGNQLSSAKLSTPLSLFAGAWTLKINNSQARVEITAGAVTEFKPGALLVKGATDEYYYVFDGAGNQLASAKLGQALSFAEGSYTLKLNNAPVPIKVEAGGTTEYTAGSVTVKGAGDDYYYVLDPLGNQLASTRVGRSLSLPAGKYQVKRAQDTRPVDVAEGKDAVLAW